jgi:D-alanyl-D-alanine carboxypeptidase
MLMGSIRGKLPGKTAAALLTALLLALFFLGSLSCREAAGGLDQNTVEELNRSIDDFMAENGVPGCVVGVWAEGMDPWVSARGTADTETGRPMQPEDLFWIGSNTKCFTATVVLQLVDEGGLSLEDKLSQFYPEVPNADRITIRMLLNHTSGIPEHTQNARFIEQLTIDPLKKWTTQELIDIGTVDVPNYPPGEDFHYSNTNYTILAGIIEKVTGNPFPEELDTRILKPVGLEHTYLPDGPDDFRGEDAHGYVDVEGTPYDITYALDPSVGVASGSLISDIQDMNTWARVLGTGELLSDEAFLEQTQWLDRGDPPGTFMIGLGIVFDHGFLGFHGEFGGIQSTEMYLPARDGVIVMFLNMAQTPTDSTELFRTIARTVFPDDYVAGESAD